MNLIATIEVNGKTMKVDFKHGINCSFHVQSGDDNPNAFHLPQPEFMPFQIGDFIGSRLQGGSVNCAILHMAPHGNGTHTESVWHIAKEEFPISQVFDRWHFLCKLVTIAPTLNEQGQYYISAKDISNAIQDFTPEALIIRSSIESKKTQWSGTNPPAFEPEGLSIIAKHGVEHLLTDLPSVDPEIDGGALSAHHAFWQYPEKPRVKSTITEMLNVPKYVNDGIYLIQFGIAPLHSDASPSMITLYPLKDISS
jgi:kynurenine formamidase